MIELAAGTVVAGKYRITGVLGAGAMGVVYRAEQLDAEGRGLREVALKTMQPSLSADARFAKRFLREVRIAASLSSPFVVTIYDAGRAEDGSLYFTMELVRGRTLREVLDERGRLDVAQAVGIAAQICEAIAEAHGAAEPIVHRDLKPANIFVDDRRGEDRVKVNDFGIAKVIGEETSALTSGGSSPGTPRYMPPEQWRGEHMDGRADLYALGVILYECLAGAPPFSGAIETVMYKHLNEPPAPLPASVPAELRELVASLLAKRPQDRPRDALAVKRSLDAIAEATPQHLESDRTEPMGMREVAPPPAALRPGASASRLAIFGATGIALVAALLVGGWWLSPSTQVAVVEPPAKPTMIVPTAVPAVPTAAAIAPTRAPIAPTAAPVAPTAAPVQPTAAPPPVEDAKACDRAPLSEADVKSWIDAYRRALVGKNVAKLRELGVARSDDDIEKLRRKLDSRRNLEVDVEDLEIRTTGPRAEVSYSLAQRWRDPNQPSMVFDFDAERRALGRADCRVVALP